MARVTLVLAVSLASLVLLLTGCGAGGPLSVKEGMSAKDVRARAGEPVGIIRGCWWYSLKSGDHLAVCFKSGVVSHVKYEPTI
jgi:hypothetical protein